MKLKPISKPVTTNNYKRFPTLFICFCPTCNKKLKREDKCGCGQEIDWYELE